jgi:hypothetical protein
MYNIYDQYQADWDKRKAYLLCLSAVRTLDPTVEKPPSPLPSRGWAGEHSVLYAFLSCTNCPRSDLLKSYLGFITDVRNWTK